MGLPPVDALNVIGPVEVFSYANIMHKGDAVPYVLELVCLGSDRILDGDAGIGLTVHMTHERERSKRLPIDTSIIATAFRTIRKIDETINWIQTRAQTVRRVYLISVSLQQSQQAIPL